MSQGQKFFDDLGRLMNDAASMADGARREAESAFRGQMERIVNDLNLVKREDYDALRDMVTIQGEEIEALRREIDALKGGEKTE
jgi:BMFP domain-containing protein YqiC